MSTKVTILILPGLSPRPPYTAGLCSGIISFFLPEPSPLVDSCVFTLDLALYSWYIVLSLNVTVDFVPVIGLPCLSVFDLHNSIR